MKNTKGNRPAEIFGFPIDNQSPEAQKARKKHWCPFIEQVCNKRSGLLNYPFGVCSVESHGGVCTICPQRFEEPDAQDGISRVLKDIAIHYFGDVVNVIPFPEVKLPNIGTIDYVLVKHKSMKAEVDDFVAVEFQTDSTTGTGQVVQGIKDFVAGKDVSARNYRFGMNTYDTIKRSMTQFFNKGIVYELWGTKCYWVIQEYIYANLAKRYGLKAEGFSPEQASRFALYDFVSQGDRLILKHSRYVSSAVEEIYQAMRHNPGLPDKDKFVTTLNKKLRAKLNITLSAR